MTMEFLILSSFLFVSLCINKTDSLSPLSPLRCRLRTDQLLRRSFLQIPISASTVAILTNKPTVAAAAFVPTVREGMDAFAAGKVEESIEIYNTILEQYPQRKPYLWQRGLSLYYADRFQEGADQFAADVAVNPNDTEEQIWHLLCLAQGKEYGSLAAARPFKLTVGRDRRPVMRAVQSLFLSGTPEEEKQLLDLAQRTPDVGSRFYAALYLSLYYESNGLNDKAKTWMQQAVKTEYATGKGAGDPMVELSKVALKKRGWV